MVAIFKAPIAILRPLFVKYIVNNQIASSDYGGLLMMIGLMIGVLIIEAILNYCFILSTNFLGQNVIRDLRVRVYNHLLKLRLTYFDNTPIGTLPSYRSVSVGCKYFRSSMPKKKNSINSRI